MYHPLLNHYYLPALVTTVVNHYYWAALTIINHYQSLLYRSWAIMNDLSMNMTILSLLRLSIIDCTMTIIHCQLWLLAMIHHWLINRYQLWYCPWLILGLSLLLLSSLTSINRCCIPIRVRSAMNFMADSGTGLWLPGSKVGPSEAKWRMIVDV